MTFAVWVAAARPRTLPAAVAPVMLGSVFAWHDGHFSAGAAALCLTFALLVQIGTNFANDYYDFVKGADTAARVGPRRAVASGLIAPVSMRNAMAGVFAIAFAVGLGLLPWGGWPLLVVGVTSIVCGIAYTGGPWPLGYLGLGDIFVFLFFGLVAVCTTYFVQAGSLTTEVVVAATAIGGLAANILVVNNYRDVETDSVAGKRTLVVRFGRGFARAQFSISLFVAFAVPLLFLALGHRLWLLLPVGAAPMAWSHVRRLRTGTTPQELIALLGDTGKLLALYALLFSAGLVLERVA
jgi:1,4-dihydroxy-2-naphthoate polyprenyltransferase